jgi:indolepyruvate ferredoxin oxidoreductase beta subunit
MKTGWALLVVGVGGQGVLSTARLLGKTAVEAGADVRVGQIYGLSQRGGSVEAIVRIDSGSTAFFSPNEADVVLALEPLEAARAIPKMRPEATVLVNRTPIVPAGMALAGVSYPDLDSIVASIGDVVDAVHVVDGDALATEAGDARLLNVVMLGVLAGLKLLPLPAGVLASTVQRFGSSTEPEARKAAFGLGERLGRDMASDTDRLARRSV